LVVLQWKPKCCRYVLKRFICIDLNLVGVFLKHVCVLFFCFSLSSVGKNRRRKCRFSINKKLRARFLDYTCGFSGITVYHKVIQKRKLKVTNSANKREQLGFRYLNAFLFPKNYIYQHFVLSSGSILNILDNILGIVVPLCHNLSTLPSTYCIHFCFV
jgi:hypothetical protein